MFGRSEGSGARDGGSPSHSGVPPDSLVKMFGSNKNGGKLMVNLILPTPAHGFSLGGLFCLGVGGWGGRFLWGV